MNLKIFFPIGDPRLDDDHRRLELAIDVLASSQAQDRFTALHDLRQVAAAHFESEDADLSRMADGNALSATSTNMLRFLNPSMKFA
ncbi:MAG: hypothetical protein IPK34_04680 [Ramlibacter sp.]|nr:hypothetical protein [Ramlibacter sp.]